MRERGNYEVKNGSSLFVHPTLFVPRFSQGQVLGVRVKASGEKKPKKEKRFDSGGQKKVFQLTVMAISFILPTSNP